MTTATAYREPASVAEYRLARAAQDQRFDDYVGGGLDHTDTDTTEYRAYFGLGEYAGSGVEVRLTYGAWLRSSREPVQSATEWLAAHPEIAAQFDPEPVEPEPTVTEWDIDPISPADRAEYARIVVRDITEQTSRPATTAADVFRMSGAELAVLVGRGDSVAAAEVARRVARRAVKAGRMAGAR